MNPEETKEYKEYLDPGEAEAAMASSLNEPEVQEALASLYFTKLIQMQNTDEEITAMAVDRLLAGKECEIPEAQEVLSACYGMDSVKSTPLPEALRYCVDSFFKSPAKKKSPSLIVKIVEEGIQVVASSLQGFALMSEAQIATRSAAKQANRIEVSQSSIDTQEMLVDYKILRESKDEIMLALELTKTYGQYTLQLKQDGRTVDSRMLRKGEYSTAFNKLKPGEYELEISGPANLTVGILIHSAA